MNHHLLARVERTQQILSAPSNMRDAHARQAVDQRFFAGASHRSFAANFNTANAFANNVASNASPNRFYFRQLGHALLQLFAVFALQRVARNFGSNLLCCFFGTALAAT